MATLDHEKVAQLVSGVRQLAGTLLTQANDLSNLDQIGKGKRVLITTQIGETLTHLQDQGGKLLSAAKNSKTCFTNLQSLHLTLQETQKFFSELKDVTAVFLVKRKMKQKCTELANTILAKRTQLFSSVTMALVSGPMGGRGVGSQKLPPGVKVVSKVGAAGSASGASASGASDVDMRSSRNTVVSSAASASSPASSEVTGTTGLAGLAIDVGTNPVAGTSAHFDEEERVALHGHADHMMYSSGHAYYYGIGRPRNLSLAFIRFQEAAEVGDSDAIMMLVRCYSCGHGVERNVKVAQEWLLQGVQAGSPAAKTQLASLLLVDNPNANSETALFLRDYISSTPAGAELKNASHSTSSSSGSSKKWKGLHRKTLDHMQIAALAGDVNDDNSDAISQMGIGGETRKGGAGAGGDDDMSSSLMLTEHERDIYCKEGVTLLLDAASDGDLNAQCNLGLVNQEAGNLEDAYKWYLASSNDGCPRATCLLGMMLLRGEGCPDNKKDEHKAYALFISAARGGEVDGYYYAGLCCEKGLLSDSYHKQTQPNLQLAIQFYESGASEGHLECTYSYGYLLLRQAVELLAERAPGEDRRHAALYCLTPREKAWYESTASKGVHYLRIAADRGIADARYQLGRAYMAGIGVPYDVHAAYECFQFACNANAENQESLAPALSFAGETVSISSEAQEGGYHHDLHSANSYWSSTHSKACLEAGNILYSGFGSGFPSQLELNQAARMYALAARDGNAQAMNNLGLLLEEGKLGPVVPAPASSSSEMQVGVPAEEEKMDSTLTTHGGSPQPLLAARYYVCAASHNNADAMLNLAHLLVNGGLEPSNDDMMLRFLPLPHGPLANSLLSSIAPAAPSASSSKHGMPHKQHHKVLLEDANVNIVDIANWLVDNAVTPAHSPALAQDYSALLSALENMASGAIVKRGQDKYKEGEEPSHAPDPASLKSSIGRDEGNYDYLGILEKESNEAEERHRALLEQKRGEQEEGRRLVAEVMQAVKSSPPMADAISEHTLSSKPPKLRSSRDTPPPAVIVPPSPVGSSTRGGSDSGIVASSSLPSSLYVASPAAVTMPPTDSLSVEKYPQAGKFSTPSSRGGSPAVGSMSADHTPQAGKISLDQPASAAAVNGMVDVVPDSYPLPPAQINALSSSGQGAVNSGVSDSKIRSSGATSMQSQSVDRMMTTNGPARSAKRQKQAFALTSLATDLDDSVDSTYAGEQPSPSNQSQSQSQSQSQWRGTVGSLDISATNTNSDVDLSTTITAGGHNATIGGGGLSETGKARSMYTYGDGGAGDSTAEFNDEDGDDEEDLSFSHASLSKISATVAKGLPPKPPSPSMSMVPPSGSNYEGGSLGKPTPSISPRTTGTASGSATAADSKATKSSAANRASAAAMFGGDDEEDEFEFSLASRDSTAISASASRDFDRTANSSLDASASGGNAGASKPSKSKKSKSKTRAPPRSLQNLSSSFEFDSSFN